MSVINKLRRIADLLVNLGTVISGVGGGGALVGFKLADESKVGTATLVIDGDLQVELEANSKYSVEVMILHNIHATPDMKYTMVGPAGATGQYGVIDSSAFNNVPLIDLGVVSTRNGSTVDRLGQLIGFVETTNAGTFGFQWAQNNVNANAITIQQGSWISLNKL